VLAKVLAGRFFENGQDTRVFSIQEHAGPLKEIADSPPARFVGLLKIQPSGFSFLQYGKQGKAYFPTKNYA
jgi:hypothetical protein